MLYLKEKEANITIIVIKVWQLYFKDEYAFIHAIIKSCQKTQSEIFKNRLRARF